VIEPLKLSFEVECGASHAFVTWTARASAWWPMEHTMAREPGLAIVFEPRVRGRIFERTSAGTENEWGEITHWDPPRRLVYKWFIATERASATDVEIRFTELGRSRTRVEIEHRGWERLGDRGEGWKRVNVGGWDGTLPVYVEACKQPS
jgi:hypothetical protein